jgi:hypothetical protein
MERVRAVRPPRVYVHVDGPREDREEDALLTEACRMLGRGIDWPCEVHTLFRERNMGLREGVGDALNWFFHGKNTVLYWKTTVCPIPLFSLTARNYC